MNQKASCSVFFLLAFSLSSRAHVSLVSQNDGEHRAQVQHLVDGGRKLLHLGQVERAQAVAESILDINGVDQNNIEAKILLTDTLLAQEQYHEALQVISAITHSSSEPRMRATMGLAETLDGRTEFASSENSLFRIAFKTSIVKLVGDMDALPVGHSSGEGLQACFLFFRGMFPPVHDSGIYDLLAADKLVPHNDAITLMLGRRYFEQKDFAKAKPYLQVANQSHYAEVRKIAKSLVDR